MPELKCQRCGDLFIQDHRNLDVCSQCAEEIEADTPDEPDMSGADGANSGER